MRWELVGGKIAEDPVSRELDNGRVGFQQLRVLGVNVSDQRYKPREVVSRETLLGLLLELVQVLNESSLRT